MFLRTTERLTPTYNSRSPSTLTTCIIHTYTVTPFLFLSLGHRLRTHCRCTSYFCPCSYSMTHTRTHTHGRIPLDEGSACRRDNTQHSQQIDIYALGGIRTRNPSKRASADPRLRPCQNLDQLNFTSLTNLFLLCLSNYLN